MKLICRILTVTMLVVVLMALGTAGVSAAPDVNAAAAVVMDADTGAFYYEKNADQMRVPASMTKLMTAYVVFEELKAGNISLDTMVTVTAHGASVAANGTFSNVPLYKGEQYSVDTMIKLMLIPSSCGACSTMADFISGSESAFVDRMNKEAALLGMTSAFTTSHGALNHYTTNARSMAILVRAFIKKHPEILGYTSLGSVTFKGTTYKNTNKFLGSDYYAGVDGMKTGTSSVAGGCIAATGKIDGRRIVVIVMGSSARYTDARKLLDYGFSCVKASDTSLAGTVVDLGSKRNGIRVGTDFVVSAKMSHVASGFIASGGWSVNGKTISEFSNQRISNGATLEIPLNLDAYAGNPVSIGFYFNLPNGTKKAVEKEFTFSEEEPCAFRDVDGHWAEKYIAAMKKTTVLSGYPGGTFAPENSITRAEFITGFVRLLDSFDLIDVVENAQSTFSDCQGHWAEDYIAAAHAAGIAAGRSDRIFDPEEKIARQEITAFIARALNYTATETELTFSDAATIDGWARTSVLACVEHQVISGYPDGTFVPHGNAKRAEIATVLARVYDQLKSEKENSENNDSSEENDGEQSA